MSLVQHDKCTHGKTWAEDCAACEIISLRETIASFEPMVIKAKNRLNDIMGSVTSKREPMKIQHNNPNGVG